MSTDTRCPKCESSQIIEDAYLRTVSRVPSPREQSHAKQHVNAANSVRSGMTDLTWALLNTKEFILNH